MTKKYKLDDICDFINGGAWSDKEYSHKGTPVLKVSNFKPNGFEIDSPSYLPTDAITKYEKNLLTVNDLVIATVGSHPNLTNSAAGRSCIIPENISGYLLNQNAVCVRSKDEDVLNQKYLCYLGQTHEFKHYIQSRGKGAANQMRIAIGAIKDYEVVLPILSIQHCIAEILSAYDDLIENNQKQIKLLEEAAMLLYKEWFVKLRFPGHENVKIVDGLPEGWKKGNLQELIDIKYGKDHKKLHDGDIPIYGSGGIMRRGNQSLYTGASVLIPRKGSLNNILFINEQFWTVDTMFYSVPKRDFIMPYVYLYLKGWDMYAMNTGAAVPSTTTETLNLMQVFIPSEQLLEKFDIAAKNYFSCANALKAQIDQAKIARDKLLPKLMSGEIEVL